MRQKNIKWERKTKKRNYRDKGKEGEALRDKLKSRDLEREKKGGGGGGGEGEGKKKK